MPAVVIVIIICIYSALFHNNLHTILMCQQIPLCIFQYKLFHMKVIEICTYVRNSVTCNKEDLCSKKKINNDKFTLMQNCLKIILQIFLFCHY